MRNIETGENCDSIYDWLSAISEDFTANYSEIQSYVVPTKFMSKLDHVKIAGHLCKACKDINEGLGYRAMMNFVVMDDLNTTISITFERP